MALQVSTPKRVFIVKKKNKKDDIILKDPHPDMTTQEVINHYKAQYPEISTAVLEGPKVEENQATYTFKTNIGTHG